MIRKKWGPISYGMGWANASNTPYRKWKRDTEEGGIITPFIMHWPAGIKKNMHNKILSTPSSLIDVMPTFLELAGASYPATFNSDTMYALEGRSMAPLLKGKTIAAHEYMYFEHEGKRAIRKGNWKAVKDRGSRNWELFNLSSDRSEQHNVAKENSAILNELITKWQEWATSHLVIPQHSAIQK